MLGDMNTKIHPVAPLLGLLTFSSATTFGLHQLGKAPWLHIDWSHLGRWLDTTPPTEALLSAVRVLGLGCGWWILLSTSFYVTARLRRATGALRIATPVTLPFIRTLSARVLAGTVAVTTLANGVPAVASTDRPPTTPQLHAYPVPVTPSPSHPASSIPQTPGTAPFLFPLPSLHAGPGPNLPAEVGDEALGDVTHPHLSSGRRITPGDHYRIVAGDHLWSVARRALAQSMGQPPTAGQITTYWVDLIEANRQTIRSADPNLIYPGERILLPQIRGVPPTS